MRVCVHTGYFYPEVGSMRIVFEITKYLRSHGYDMHVVTTFPRREMTTQRGRYRSSILAKETINGFNVTRLGSMSAHCGWTVSKLLEFVLLPFIVFIGSFLIPRPDIILTSNNPPTMWVGAFFAGKIRGAPFAVRVDDIYPNSLVDLDLVHNKFILGFLSQLANLMYRSSDRIIVHSEEHKSYLIAHKNVVASKISTIPLWADLDEIDLLRNKARIMQASDTFFPKDKFVVVFAGLMSFAQNLEPIIDAAHVLRNDESFRFMLVGDGPLRGGLELKTQKMGLSNVRFLPLQPREKYFEIITNSSVCIVPLTSALSTPVVPSKLIEIMACGRPVIVIASGKNQALRRLVNESRCGFFIETFDGQTLAEKLLSLSENHDLAELLGSNGYRYVKQNLSLDICGKLHRHLLAQMAEKRAL